MCEMRVSHAYAQCVRVESPEGLSASSSARKGICYACVMSSSEPVSTSKELSYPV